MNGTEHCRRCMFMRIYLMVAGALVVAMYLQPEWAARVAQMVPPPEQIAWIISVAIPALFFFKLLAPSLADSSAQDKRSPSSNADIEKTLRRAG